MTSPDACDQRKRIYLLFSGHVSQGIRDSLGEHLSECGECQELFEEIASKVDIVKDKADTLPRTKEESDAVKKILQGVATLDGAEKETTPSDDSEGILDPCDDERYIGKIGEYFVIESIGQGGMGAVFKAIDPRLNRFVAIKLSKIRRLPYR